MKINFHDRGSVARQGTKETGHGCQIAGDVLGVGVGSASCFWLKRK